MVVSHTFMLIMPEKPSRKMASPVGGWFLPYTPSRDGDRTADEEGDQYQGRGPWPGGAPQIRLRTPRPDHGVSRRRRLQDWPTRSLGRGVRPGGGGERRAQVRQAGWTVTTPGARGWLVPIAMWESLSSSMSMTSVQRQISAGSVARPRWRTRICKMASMALESPCSSCVSSSTSSGPAVCSCRWRTIETRQRP